MAKKAGTGSAKSKAVEAASEIPEPVSGAATIPVPTMLSEVIGQSAPVRTLQTVLASNRVHHAWIFAGPSGVGKRSTAIAFAAALLDPTLAANLSGELEPDLQSSTQALIRAGTHPDLHVITKELAAVSREDSVRKSKQSGIAKEVVMEFLIESAARTRVVQSGTKVGKVFIMDEAELLNDAGQNALLKTLEEPPAGTVIILVTSHEDRLLTTIRSRCQRIDFAPLTDADMQEWFRAASRAGVAFDPAQVPWLLQFAAGSPGNAMLAINHHLFAWHETLEPMLQNADKGAFAPELGSTLAKLVDERAAAWVKANKDASKDAANKAWARQMLAFLAERVRARMRASLTSRRGPTPVSDPVVDRCLHMLQAIEECERFLATNVNVTLAFENLGAQLIAEPQPMY